MADAAASLDWHPFPGVAAIRSESYRGMSECSYCGFCRGQACYTSAKADTSVAGVPEAERTGNLRVVSGARVTTVLTDADGLAAGVVYVKDGERHVQYADAVVLCGYTYENVRLLLLSTSKAFPSGLANNTDQVGRLFMTHLFLGAFGGFRGRRLNRFSGTQAQFVASDSWNGDNFDHSDRDFIGGGTLTASMEVKPVEMALSAPPSVPRWGAPYKRWLREHAGSVGSAFTQLEVLPYENFVSVDVGGWSGGASPFVEGMFEDGIVIRQVDDRLARLTVGNRHDDDRILSRVGTLQQGERAPSTG
jgi:gluconate 2-dehydrogenase alpha chain